MELLVDAVLLFKNYHDVTGDEKSTFIPRRHFPCYLHSTGGMLGDGTACDDDDDDGIDLCTSCSSSASAASVII